MCVMQNSLHSTAGTKHIDNMQFFLFLAIIISLSVVSHSSLHDGMRDEGRSLSSLTYQDCKDMSRTPEFQDNYSTWEEQVCLFWLYGFGKEEAEQYATLSIEDGDLDRNGVIDGEEFFGRPNP
ncbi:uncharacterized protein LOC127698302 isoform X1 [Mytilus californianus]|uniref:uncharacterized protein LOC127698302 isoform X1 n=1 Tax=Mytilus californianus TaxID=6549 RepID=UPI002246A6C5|nr:uncharacterized protein LOC127698302 isoform X1 [Mytilus californianus]